MFHCDCKIKENRNAWTPMQHVSKRNRIKENFLLFRSNTLTFVFKQTNSAIWNIPAWAHHLWRQSLSAQFRCMILVFWVHRTVTFIERWILKTWIDGFPHWSLDTMIYLRTLVLKLWKSFSQMELQTMKGVRGLSSIRHRLALLNVRYGFIVRKIIHFRPVKVITDSACV